MAARNARIEFGLMTLAVKLEVAVEKPQSYANLCTGQPGFDAHDPSPLRAPRTCTSCGIITDTTALVKGIQQGKAYAIVTQDEVAEEKEKYSTEYKGVLSLVPHPAADFLDATAPGESLHYVTPADRTGENIYQMLVKLVTDHPEVVLASLYTPVSVTSLYMLGVREGTLVLEQRTRTQALKPAPSVGGRVDDGLYKMLEATLEAMVTPYDANQYQDRYAAAIAEIAAARDVVAVAETGAASKNASVASDTEDTLRKKLQLLKGAA